MIQAEYIHETYLQSCLRDLKMPEMDGIEALRKIKSDDKLRHIPVIMISAADEIENVTQCIEIGAEGYLSKPFDSMLLRARINASLEKKRVHEQDYIENVDEGRKGADQLRIANDLKATKYARTYFRICLFVPLLVPLPFLLFKGDAGLSTLFIGTLAFGMPPYVLMVLLPLVFLIGRMTERQIVVGTIFLPVIYPFVYGLFWLIVPNFINTVSIRLTNHAEWVFLAIVIPAAYSIIFLSGYTVRRKLITWDK